MFGIESISWGQFTAFILVLLTGWYLAVLLYCLFRKKASPSRFYEDISAGGNSFSEIHPVKVSSESFPSALLPYPNEDIPLEIAHYEETGEESGYEIDTFSGKQIPSLRQLLNKIQYQK